MHRSRVGGAFKFGHHQSRPGDGGRYVASIGIAPAYECFRESSVSTINAIMNARVHVHATFTVPAPVPLFVVSVEILEGNVCAGMFLRVPLNSMLDVTAGIASIGPVNNSWGLPLVGLALRCEDEGVREIIDMMNIGDEILAVTHDGED